MSSYQEGYDAYNRGDYDTALKEWRPLAEQGDVMAQYNLGLMHHKGQGVSRDYHEAVKWYRLAADQGFALAQTNLGRMYVKGHGVPKDYVQAYMWYTLAADQGTDDLAAKFQNGLKKSMTPAQLAGAQRLAREWTPKGK